MSKKDEPKNAWEYTAWLYISGRLTADEHTTLRKYLLQLEEDSANLGRKFSR